MFVSGPFLLLLVYGVRSKFLKLPHFNYVVFLANINIPVYEHIERNYEFDS
jgi:hypothetical protein